MDGSETGLVRWSPNADVDSFIHVNVNHRVVQLYRPTGYAKTGRFEYQNVSKHEDFPILTSFDWSPTLTGVVAVGTPTGVVNLLKIDDDSNTYTELSLKMSRTCQAVSFSTTNKLAVGLDRVRSDRSLNIWDVNRLSTSARPVASADPEHGGFPKGMEAFYDPIDAREPSVSVSSVRFFEDQPSTLVVGLKGQGLRIHDLRTNTPAAVQSFQTRCNNNLAIDYADPNYFASSALDHPGIMIWDKRAAGRATASPFYLDAVDVDEMPWGGALRLDRAVTSGSEQAINESKASVIRSLRYCRDHRGMLGVLSGTGQLKVYETKQEYCPSEMAVENSPSLLEVRRSNEMDNQYSDPRHKNERIVSFDWVTIGSPALRPRVLVVRANGNYDILEKPSFTTTYPFKLIPWSAPYRGIDDGASYHNYHTVMQLEPAQTTEILYPVAFEETLADIPIFASDAKEINGAVQQAQKERAAQLDAEDLDKAKKAKLPAEYFTATSVARKLKLLRQYEKKHVRPQSNRKSAQGSQDMSRRVDLADSTASLASLSGRPLTSQELHESLLSSTFARSGFPLEAQAVLDHVMLLRAKEQYLFDCSRNKEIVADDPWLRDVWGWVGAAEAAAISGDMSAHFLDLSYLGVVGIWLEDLGANQENRIYGRDSRDRDYRESRESRDQAASFPEASNWQRTIISICRKRNVRQYEGVDTKKPHHRQLCLEICGWGRPPASALASTSTTDAATGEKITEKTESTTGRTTSYHTMAAAQALFRGDNREAVQILKSASTEHPELLFVSLALQLMGRRDEEGIKHGAAGGMHHGADPHDRHAQLDFDEALASKTDPYLRAISSLIATGDWTTIAHQTSLPLRERVFVAVRMFDDDQLTEWLRDTLAEAISTGDVEGLVLTGLTESAVDIWARYVEKFHDVQTATLVMSMAAPRYVDDYRCTAWRNAYRAYLQRHRAYFQRAKFEVESTKRSKGGDGRPKVAAPARQIALRCVYCDAQTRLGGTPGPPATANVSSGGGGGGVGGGANPNSAGPGGSAGGVGGGTAPVNSSLPARLASAGVSCPICFRNLPRCVVCLEIVGTPRSDRPESSGDSDTRLAAKFPTFCLKCDHVLHLDHARQWFSRHSECPVPECRCRCNFRANPELNYK